MNTRDLNALLVVIASHICNILTLGLFNVLGPVFVAIQTYFQSSSVRTSWIISLYTCLTLGTAPISVISVKLMGYRSTVVLGGILSSIGYLVTAFAPTLEFIYFSFGVLTGIGHSLVFVSHLSIVGLCIKQRYAQANAVVVAGSGIGTFILTPLWQFLIDTYGWRGSFIVMSAINAHICVCGLLFRIPTIHIADNDHEMRSDDAVKTTEGNEEFCRPCTLQKAFELFGFNLFCSYPLLVIYIVSYVLGTAIGVYGMLTFIVARANIIGLGSNTDIALSMSIFGALGILGRVSPALIMYIKPRSLSSLRLFGLVYSLIGFINILSFTVNSFTLHCVYTACLGLVCGIAGTLISQVARDIVGPSNLLACGAICIMLSGIVTLIASPIGGWIYDVTGDYNNSFFFYGLCSLLAGIIALTGENIVGRCQKRDEEVVSNTGDVVCESKATNTG